MRIGIEHDITNIATLNPSTILLLCRKIGKWQDRIIRDIEMGALDRNFYIAPETRRAIEKELKPNPTRANELRRILIEKNELLPKDIWPNLEIIECWKGGAVKIYLKELPKYFGGVAIRDFGCLSSEARSSIAMSDEGADGVLAIDTNFYEFIPAEDIDKDRRRVLLCDALEAGKNYYLIVTTPGGLYRYNIDDIIRVKGFFNKTPVIEFLQKGHNAISMVDEKLYESHVIEAVNRALDETGLFVKFFCACAQQQNGKSRYIFLVEFNDSPDIESKTLLLKSIEKELCVQNTEYAELRRAQLLAPSVLKVAKTGQFEKYRETKIKGGAHDTQFKMPQLTADPDFQKNFEIVEEVELP